MSTPARWAGEYDYHKFTLGLNYYQTIKEDLLERKTILSYRADAGYITGGAPFFESFTRAAGERARVPVPRHQPAFGA